MAEFGQFEAVNRLGEKLKLAGKYSRRNAFQEELIEYIQSKFAKYDIPTHELMEVVQYILIGNDFVVRDEVDRAYNFWNRQMKKGTKRSLSKEGTDNA
jgi:hypothetical protein